MDEDEVPFDDLEEERVNQIFEENRENLVDFYRQLVEMGEGEIPKDMLKQAGKSEAMQKAEDRIYDKLELVKNGELKTSEETAEMMHKLCLAYFLVDRSRKLEELSAKSHNVSLYCLYLALEERVCDMLSERYYDLSLVEVMDEYIDTEPMVSACSELCGLGMPSLDELIEEHQENWLKQQLLLP